MRMDDICVAPVENRIVDPRNARSGDYLRQLLEIQESGNCPFCPGGQTYVEEMDMFIAQNDDWLIKHSKVPYGNAQVHLVIISRAHKTRLAQVTGTEWDSMTSLMDSCLAKAGLPTEGGTLFVREGATELTGATVCHLHFNYIVPAVIEGATQVVTVRFGGWTGTPEWAK